MRSVGHPRRSYGYACGALGRDALQAQASPPFRSKQGEKCRLAVFDIDGTLTDTCDIDAACYVGALAEVFGFSSAVGDYAWAEYAEVTDSALAAALVERHRGREITTAELARLEAALVDRLSVAFEREPALCRPIPGAVELIARLTASEDWLVALATGGFRRSALIKLAQAGFDPPEILRTANDSSSRVSIVEAVIADAGRIAGAAPRAVVLLGDAPWDVSAAAQLGLPCVVVADGSAGRRLACAGAVAVLRDFRDPAEAHEALERATNRAE